MTKDVKSARPRPTVANLEKRVEAIEISAATKEDLQELQAWMGERIGQLAEAAASKEDVKELHFQIEHQAQVQSKNGLEAQNTTVSILNKHGNAIKANADIASATQTALTAHEKAQRDFATECLTRLRGAHDAIRALTKLLRPFLIGGAVAVVVFVALFLIGLT